MPRLCSGISFFFFLELKLSFRSSNGSIQLIQKLKTVLPSGHHDCFSILESNRNK
ncbi:hypothetical protein N665_0470s0006 [Sinapis alba]|nr:hypothetical protein N665_0470s0006 [Sinapis alba]KAF8090640.1 hypothetical protein N665_0470s0006 [Sinapis alba]